MLQSAWSVALAAVVLPPAGLVLLWLRSGAGVWKKVAGSALIAGWSVAWMMLFFGLRFQLDGSGIRPVPTFYNRESHYSELERSRAGRSAVPVVQAAAQPAEPGKAELPAPAGTQPQAPTGPISAALIATAGMTKRRSSPNGPRADCL